MYVAFAEDHYQIGEEIDEKECSEYFLDVEVPEVLVHV